MLASNFDAQFSFIKCQLINAFSEKIMRALNKADKEYNDIPRITANIGIFIGDPKTTSRSNILKCADIAMYTAKAKGKNRAHLFVESDLTSASSKALIEFKLQHAVKKEQIEMYFQPIVVRNQDIVGFEALARWHDEKLGYLSPDIFITHAEQNSLIEELGHQIISMAMSGYKQLKASGQFPKSSFISINMSPQQLAADYFEGELLEKISKHAISPSEIKLEITETTIIQNLANIGARLARLRNQGFRISIDDFGTGFSSLSYLLKLPIDEVKIDKSFVSSMTHNDQPHLMVESIISLCHEIKLKTVAEGIEYKAEASALKSNINSLKPLILEKYDLILYNLSHFVVTTLNLLCITHHTESGL